MRKFLLFNTYDHISDWLFPLVIWILFTYVTGTWMS